MCSQFATPEILAFHPGEGGVRSQPAAQPGQGHPDPQPLREYGRERMAAQIVAGPSRAAALLMETIGPSEGWLQFLFVAVPVLSLVGTWMGLRTAGRLAERRQQEGRSVGASLQIDGLARARARIGAGGGAIAIRGAAPKNALRPGPRRGEPLDTGRRGIVNYEPTELVVTVRRHAACRRTGGAAGRAQGRCWPSSRRVSPRRHRGRLRGGWPGGPAAGGGGRVRDFVLGVRMIDGRGDCCVSAAR